MTKYKLVVSDLDGTLLDENMQTGEKNDAAIRALAEKGISFIPSSGRTLHEIPKSLLENPDIRYVIYSNGTVVYDLKEKKIIISNEISAEASKKVLDICRKYEVYVCPHYDGNAYSQNLFGKVGMEYYGINEYYKGILNALQSYDDISVIEKREGTFESFVLFFHDDAELDKCKAELSKLDGILVTSSVAHNLEVVSASSGKGAALREFSRMLGIKKEEIITIGDNANDISMFEVAGLSLCASGGTDLAKSSADMVICSCKDGVADFVLKNII